jgi:hypothetical protein
MRGMVRRLSLVLHLVFFLSASQFSPRVSGEETSCSARTPTRMRPSGMTSSGQAPPVVVKDLVGRAGVKFGALGVDRSCCRNCFAGVYACARGEGHEWAEI